MQEKHAARKRKKSADSISVEKYIGKVNFADENANRAKLNLNQIARLRQMK
jgi:hypothetical protein